MDELEIPSADEGSVQEDEAPDTSSRERVRFQKEKPDMETQQSILKKKRDQFYNRGRRMTESTLEKKRKQYYDRFKQRSSTMSAQREGKPQASERATSCDDLSQSQKDKARHAAKRRLVEIETGEPSFFDDSSTPQGKFLDTLFIAKPVRPGQQKVQHTVSEGLDVLDALTQEAYPASALQAHEIFSLIVFILSTIVAIWDLVAGFEHLRFKLTALGLSLLDFGIAVASFDPIVVKCSCYSCCKTGDPNALKHQILAQNIISELLIYPLLLLTVFGVAVERGWHFDDTLNSIGFVLVFLEVADLVWTYLERLIMLQNLRNTLNTILEKNHSGTAGYILTRTFIVILGNTVLFALMIVMLFREIRDNVDDDNPFAVDVFKAYLLLSALLVPFVSIVSFIVSNINFYEQFLVTITVEVQEKQALLQEIEEKGSDAVRRALETAMNRSTQNNESLQAYRNARWYQKLLTPLSNWYTYIVLYIWGLLLIGQLLLGLAYTNSGSISTTQLCIYCAFIIVTGMVNVQSLFLCLLSPIFIVIYTILLLIGLCCKCCGQKSQAVLPENSINAKTN